MQLIEYMSRVMYADIQVNDHDYFCLHDLLNHEAFSLLSAVCALVLLNPFHIFILFTGHNST